MSRRGPRASGHHRASSALIAAINVRGIRQSSFVLNALTIGKLTPLVIFIAAGLFAHRSGAADRRPDAVARRSSRRPALLLIFAFGGYEVVPVPPARPAIRGARCRSRWS